MKRYGIVMGVMIAFFLILYLSLSSLLETMQISFLQDPTLWMKQWNVWVAASVGLFLLIGDVLLPVPSSLVMIAHGALLGISLGTVVSLLGGVGATAVGFLLGRRGGPLLSRLVTEKEKERADALLKKWGVMAILLTRPIPLLAETVSILAGASPMGWGKMLAASILGTAPAAFLYALAGASAESLANGMVVFGAVLFISGLFWIMGRWMASGGFDVRKH